MRRWTDKRPNHRLSGAAPPPVMDRLCAGRPRPVGAAVGGYSVVLRNGGASRIVSLLVLRLLKITLPDQPPPRITAPPELRMST